MQLTGAAFTLESCMDYEGEESIHTGHYYHGSVKLIMQHASSMYKEVRSALFEAVWS
jgi:hypothetical protein